MSGVFKCQFKTDGLLLFLIWSSVQKASLGFSYTGLLTLPPSFRNILITCKSSQQISNSTAFEIQLSLGQICQRIPSTIILYRVPLSWLYESRWKKVDYSKFLWHFMPFLALDLKIFILFRIKTTQSCGFFS